jgi:ABC-type Fe3+/spermidine/putrescine transport system ATPase subunit
MDLPAGTAAGVAVDLAIRPENIHLDGVPAADGPAGRIVESTVLANLSEYYVELAGGQVLRVQTHPLQRFAAGDAVAIRIDAAQCSVFRRGDAAAGSNLH